VYHTHHPPAPAALHIRIRHAAASSWLSVPLLSTTPGWARVDDGNGPLWVMWEAVHPGDWPALATFERLKEAKN
jgi:hypothetical protein